VLVVDRRTGPLHFVLEKIHNVRNVVRIGGSMDRFLVSGEGCPDCEAPEIRGRRTLVIGVGTAGSAAATGHHAQFASPRGETNVPGVWVAGNLQPMSQQVAVSMGTGNIAALMIDQTLRRAAST
jgi:alkyl hydroperoxide reductase subunit AhpF